MPDLTLLSAQLSNDAAIEALTNGLETMAFISLMPAEEPYTPPADLVRIEIAFSGPARGSLEVCTSRELGRAIAVAVTGEPESTISSEDALKELMNVVCGSLLRQQDLPEGFTISLPLVHSNSADDDWTAFVSSPTTAVVDAEGTIVAIRLSFADETKG